MEEKEKSETLKQMLPGQEAEENNPVLKDYLTKLGGFIEGHFKSKPFPGSQVTWTSQPASSSCRP